MKVYGRVDVYTCIYIFLTSALAEGGQLHAPAALPRGKSPRYPLDRRLGGAQSQSGRFGEEKNLDPIGKVTSSITQKLQSFINRCLRRIINVRWPEVISNIMLWETTGETPTELQIKKRKRKWIGHTIGKDENAVERIALDWNPQGTRKRGREEDQRRPGGGQLWKWHRDVEGVEEVGSRQKSLEKLRGSPLLLHRRQ
jgi:hypothetical protein